MAKKKATAEDTETKKVAKKATPKKATKKKAVELDADGNPIKKKRKTRKKKAEVTRRKLFWGVFNHSMKRVALYEFNQKKAAEKRALELSPEGKPPHFVQKVKEDIVEVVDPEVTADESTAAPKKTRGRKKAE